MASKLLIFQYAPITVNNTADSTTLIRQKLELKNHTYVTTLILL